MTACAARSSSRARLRAARCESVSTSSPTSASELAASMRTARRASPSSPLIAATRSESGRSAAVPAAASRSSGSSERAPRSISSRCGTAPSSTNALARAIAGAPASPTSAASSCPAALPPVARACSRAAKCARGAAVPRQLSTAFADHASPRFAWHALHALGVPIATERSGRGTWKPWSRCAEIERNSCSGMWQSTQDGVASAV